MGQDGLIHQRVLLGEVEGVVRQLEGAGEAIPAVPVGDALGKEGTVSCAARSCALFYPPTPGAGTHCAGTGARHLIQVPAPLLRLLPVFLVGPLERLLHLQDVVLANSRDIYVPPARDGEGFSGEPPVMGNPRAAMSLCTHQRAWKTPKKVVSCQSAPGKVKTAWRRLKCSCCSGAEHTKRAFRKVVHFFCSVRAPPTSPWAPSRHQDRATALTGRAKPRRDSVLGTDRPLPVPCRPAPRGPPPVPRSSRTPPPAR